jgi:DNA processing protein
MARFGSPESVLDSEPGTIAELPRMNDEREEQIRSAICNAPLIRKRLAGFHNRGIDAATVFDSDYPQSLLELTAPPPLLYRQGEIGILSQETVAIVGTHEATAEGIAEAVRLGKLLSEAGAVVVSGLARGIDSGAHVGALQSTGKTVAVLGCGFDDIYPSEHKSLSALVAEKGLLLSEYPPDAHVTAGRLMARNRLIVGLAKSVIVVEISEGSGGTVGAISETNSQSKMLFTCFNPNRAGSSTNSMGAIHLANADDWKMVLQFMV